VGDRSYGKGTVQTMVPLTEGQLKITESKFYRISGDSTQHRGVVPDISLPSLYDPDEIGESALEHALDWDQINPVRHRRYGNLETLVPQLSAIFEQRAGDSPEFRYLQAQLALVEENRNLREVSLNEAVRRAERSERDARRLAIENERRRGLGMEPVASLDELEDDDLTGEHAGDELAVGSGVEGGGTADQDLASETRAADDDVIDADRLREQDVLLAEAGNILLDAMLLGGEAYALHAPQGK
jgi:carboxyl-terminal processing protease